MSSPSPASQRTAGFVYAFAAYLSWGVFPAFWKQLRHVAPTELIAHRVIWSFAFVALLLTGWRRWPDFLGTFRSGARMRALGLSTVLITGNWLLFIWAVNSGNVMQASLGYYINPLVNVLFARLMLGERLRRVQWLAVGLALVGVLNLAVALGQVPWVSLTLAVSFSLYGLVRKLAPVEPLTGLAVETCLATPFALAFLLAVVHPQQGRLLGANLHDSLFLVGSGVATALPLLWFALGAKRLRYSTLGIVQYVAPTGQLALAVLAYGEPFTLRHGVTFAFIWSAVLLYTVDSLRARPAPAALAPTATAPVAE
jgi:chloramphenicol-sensitive protein RarD